MRDIGGSALRSRIRAPLPGSAPDLELSRYGLDGAKLVGHLCLKRPEIVVARDTVAIRMCLERRIPVRKDRHVVFDLSKIERTADIPKATASLL